MLQDSFRGRNLTVKGKVNGSSLFHGSAEGLESSLDYVVGVGSGKLPQVQSDSGLAHKGKEKFLYQFCVKGTYFFSRNLKAVFQMTASGNICGAEDESLVHRKDDIAVSVDTAHVSKSFGKGHAQTDAYILSAVVVINIGVSQQLISRSKLP